MAAYSADRAEARASPDGRLPHFSASWWVARAATIDPSSAARSAGAAAQAWVADCWAVFSSARSAARAPAGSAAGAVVGAVAAADGSGHADHPGQFGGVRGVRLGDRVEPVGERRDERSARARYAGGQRE